MRQVVFLCFLLIESFWCHENGPHSEILQWWKDISVQRPIDCHLENSCSKSASITTRKCREWEPSNHVIKHGKIINGQLQGLVDITFGLKPKKGGKSSICLDVQPFFGERILHLSATFKNGLLQGPAKIKTDHGKTYMSDFANGRPCGIVRVWNDKSELVEVFHSATVSMKWSLEKSKYLLFQGLPTEKSLMVPLNVSELIYAGHLHPTVKTLYEVESVNVMIGRNNCILHPDWKSSRKMSWDLYMPEGLKMPHFAAEKDLCEQLNLKNIGDAKKQYLEVHDFLTKTKSEHGLIKVLNYLKPVESPVDHEKVKLPFMSKVEVIDDKTAKMSIWNGPVQSWTADFSSRDENGALHGYCGFSIGDRFFNKTGYYGQLKWSIESFSGRFIHGQLDGVVLMNTWFGGKIFATFKNGVMHGPVASYGQFPLLDIEVVMSN